MAIQIINPITCPVWNELLETNPQSSFFHTSNWARVLAESYRYTPLYLCRIESGQLTSLLPLMEVVSWLTSRRAVSLPFTDAVPVLADKESDFQALLEQAISLGKQNRWKYIEFRPTDRFFNKKPELSYFMNHHLLLEGSEEKIFKSLRNATQRNIKKARERGLFVEISTSFQSIKEFFRLNCIARKDHGLPPQPFRFFKNIYENVLSKGNGFIAGAIFNKRPVSSNVYFFHNQTAWYKYGANDRRYSHLSCSYLVMWEAIRHLLSNDYALLDFGRTDIDHQGLLQFKRGWATQETEARYYRYDIGQGAFVGSKRNFRTSYQLFRKMPAPLLRIVGHSLYRHAA